MPEKVTVREDLQIIQIESYGDVTLEEMMESLDAVIDIRQKRGLRKVFVDATRETSLPSTMPAYKFGDTFSKVTAGMRFAAAVAPHLKAEMAFLENVMRNRGAEVQMFDAADDAIAWLMDASDTPPSADT